MKFVHARTEQIALRSVNLIEGPKIPHPDSSVRGKEIELIRVTIRYVLSGEAWVVDSFLGGGLRIEAEGWVLRQDGRRSHRMWKGFIPTAPARTENGWLKKLVDGSRPTGRPELPFDVVEA